MHLECRDRHEPALSIYTVGGDYPRHRDLHALTVLVPLSTAGSFAGGGTVFAGEPPCDGLGTLADVERSTTTRAADAADDAAAVAACGPTIVKLCEPYCKLPCEELSELVVHWVECGACVGEAFACRPGAFGPTSPPPPSAPSPPLLVRAWPGTAVLWTGSVWHSAAAVTAGKRMIFVSSFDALPKERMSTLDAARHNGIGEERLLFGCGPLENAATEARLLRALLQEESGEVFPTAGDAMRDASAERHARSEAHDLGNGRVEARVKVEPQGRVG